MKYIFIVLSFFILFACAQDSPNIQQIGNLQFFIDNNKNNDVIEIEPGLQYSIIEQGDPSGLTPEINQTISSENKLRRSKEYLKENYREFKSEFSKEIEPIENYFN